MEIEGYTTLHHLQYLLSKKNIFGFAQQAEERARAKAKAWSRAVECGEDVKTVENWCVSV